MAGVPLSKVVGGFIKFAFVVVLLIAALIAFAMFAFAGVNGPVVW
jgi:hypothetical protein